MKSQNWIKSNKKLFKGLKPGKIHYVYKNNRISDKKKFGEKVVIKISICEECNTKKAGRKIKKSACNECLRGCRSQKMVNRYYKNKPPVKKGVTAKQIWYKNLIPGIVYCVLEGDEVLKLKDVKHLFKPGRKKQSPHTGAFYIGRICVCKKCGKRRFSRVRLGGLCKKCQDKRNTKECEEKKDIKTAQQIAHEITGDFKSVKTIPYIPDIFDEVERIFA